MIAYVDNDNNVHLQGAATTNVATGELFYLNAAATVQFTVQTRAYVNVPGETWPVSMTYIGGSQGHFMGVLRRTVALQDGLEYRLIATVDFGTDMDARWDIPLHAKARA